MQCHVWCCSCRHCATRGVMGVTPCTVSWASHHVWFRGCHTTCGVTGIAPYVVLWVLHRVVSWASHCVVLRASHHVVSWASHRMVSQVSYCVVPWALHRMWYRSHGHCAVVAVITPCCVAVTVVVPHGAAVTITVVTVVMVGGWAVVDPGGRGLLR